MNKKALFANRLKDLPIDGKNVFLRLDLNVPIKDGVISDDTRIQAALPTLNYVLEKARGVVVASHLGRPKDGIPEDAFSMAPIGSKLAELTNKEVILFNNYRQEPVDAYLTQLQKNQFVLLENLRFDAGETKNHQEFSKALAKGMDFYINDAFGTCHRAHASVVGIAEILGPKKCSPGFLLEKEIEALTAVRDGAKSPFAVIIGGSKVSDKIGVILNLIDKCNHLLVGGAMAYSFLKYKGIEVGKSRVEADKMDLIETIYRSADARGVKIHLPLDHVTAKEFSETSKPVVTSGVDISPENMGLDIGPLTIESYKKILDSCNTILWNGPMGVFEWKEFAKGSLAIAQAISSCTEALTVVGGGDSVAATNLAGVANKMSHISTGGGASLEFLEGKTLPGVRILQS